MALCLRIEQDLDVGCRGKSPAFLSFFSLNLKLRDHHSCSTHYPLIIDIVLFYMNLHKIIHNI